MLQFEIASRKLITMRRIDTMADPGAISEKLAGLDSKWKVHSVTTVVDEDIDDVSVLCILPDDDTVSIRLEMKPQESYERVRKLIQSLPETF